MVSFDPIYQQIKGFVQDIPVSEMIIKRERINAIDFIDSDEFGDPLEYVKGIEFEDPDEEYDFDSDKIIEIEKSINPLSICPQEGLRYSIVNIFAYIVTDLINDYMRRFTMNSNSYAPGKKCLIIMKNEFLFKTLLLTFVKKHYCSIQELQEGNIISDPRKGFDIKGMEINKSGLKESSKDILQNILFEEVLNSDKIDQMKILKRIGLFEKKIYDNLNSGKKDYYKSARIKAKNTYSDPMSQQGVKASIAYNSLCPADAEKIDLNQRNSIDILKVNITPKNIQSLKETNTEIYEKLCALMEQKEFAKGLTSIAYPSEAIPSAWVYDFIDYNTIINDNISTFPLEEIGIFKGTKSNAFTNIVAL